MTYRICKITHILDNAPAAEAGLHDGDEIVAVDAAPCTNFTLDELQQIFSKGGAGVPLRPDVIRQC